MDLQSLLVDKKTAWVDFPEMEGFSVHVVSLSRKELKDLRKRSVSQKYNRKTRVMEEVLDDENFVREFTEATIKEWKGFKLKYLESLALVDISGKDPEEELDFTIDNAVVLVTSSTEFDNWLNEVVFDLDNFR